ncbi:DUF2213 domain-containing protein [Brachyspira sp. G79]|uniref:DUF2213 domain-containing protein n=1 Tax=Brachyspira sp. G79 TaxID=1358104 RepID=UPI000BC57B63|nr:DUF2213 domain-containing protein [Brachyspira sp. G79]PCG20546.1 hypothetical protein KQ44_11480 [Brachyspira sp. G79]
MIQGLIDGSLKSPQIYEESFYIKLRITGTGITERYKEDENGEVIFDDENNPVVYKINRLEDEFLSNKFLKACVGIPVLIEHPDSKLLNGENYKNHVVGNIVAAYIKPEIKEVWGIARIYDPEVLKLINEKLKSTSPAIKTKEIKNNGSDIVEEEFEYIDHLALVVDGYWDNYSEKAIQIDSLKRIMPNSNENINNKTDEKNRVPDDFNHQEPVTRFFEAAMKEDKMPEELKEKKEEIKEEVKKDESMEEVENEETQKIASIESKLDQLISMLSNKESIKEDGEEGSPEAMATEKKQGVTLDDIASKIDMLISQIAKKEGKDEKEDMNEELSKEEIVADEEETIEDEEEKKVMVDRAYNLASKYKEEGVKYVKEREHDTKYSYIERFLKSNSSLLSDKFKSLFSGNNKVTKDNYALAVDCVTDIQKNIETKAKQELKKNNDKPVCVFDDGKVKRFKNVF